jgi:hypothetical protein
MSLYLCGNQSFASPFSVLFNASWDDRLVNQGSREPAA